MDSQNDTKDLYFTQRKKGIVVDEENSLIKRFEFIPDDVYIMNIATSKGNTFLLSTQGILYSWGTKASAVLGRQASNLDALKPGVITQIPTKIVSVAAGSNHVLALDTNGIVYSWGDNSFGQLGYDTKGQQFLPKEIPKFKSLKVVQIYAGGDSSYAVTQQGSLYVWGDVIIIILIFYKEQKLTIRNHRVYFNIFIFSIYHIEPKQVLHAPWEGKSKEVKIVFGKDNYAYCFKPSVLKYEKESEEYKRLEYQIKEKDIKIRELQIKNMDLESLLTGKSQQQLQMTEKQLKEDPLLKAINQQIKIVNNDIQLEEAENNRQADQMNQIESELSDIKQQLNEISRKENQLIGKRDAIENKIRKQQRSGGGDNLDELIKEQKRIRELLQANDNIKNTLIKRQNESDEAGLKYQDKTGQQERVMQKLQKIKKFLNFQQRLDRQRLLLDMEIERKRVVKMQVIVDNKIDLERFVSKVYGYFKLMTETTIQEIARKSQQLIGLSEIIKESNDRLSFLKSELSSYKANPNDPLYNIIYKIQEIVTDNIVIRMKMNDYVGGLLLQVSQKNEELLESRKNQDEENDELSMKSKAKVKDTQITEYIKKQKKQLLEVGKDAINVKSYIENIEKEQKFGIKSSRSCFGW